MDEILAIAKEPEQEPECDKPEPELQIEEIKEKK